MAGLFARVLELVGGDFELGLRLKTLQDFSRTVRTGEYHITNACNIRCKGCWFYEYEFDERTREQRDLLAWRRFAVEQREHGVTTALLIGGEPTLFPDRVAAFVEAMPNISISTNGLQKLSAHDFPRVCVAITLFGGGPLDDELRGIRPSGKTFSGLFDTALASYRNDDRAVFIYAVSNDSIPYIEDTVRRIGDNGNRVGLNYYSSHGLYDPLRRGQNVDRLLDEALRVREKYPYVLGCDELFIRTLLTGKTHFGQFGYDTCPSISVDHPAHAARKKNGQPILPGFNAWAPDLETINFCCTSGECGSCRDSQAIYSWLLVSFKHFLDSKTSLERWLNMAECYWSGFIWSPYHPAVKGRLAPGAQTA
ncbi:MAG TPA: radical SAM protein [Polyangia bacterium]|nr:radical SAM protein [Polyangia bacterium]